MHLRWQKAQPALPPIQLFSLHPVDRHHNYGQVGVSTLSSFSNLAMMVKSP